MIAEEKDPPAGTTPLGCLALIIAMPFVQLASCLWGGLAVMLNWNWFVVPSLHAPALSYALAVGVSVFARSLIGARSTNENKQQSTSTEIIRAFTAIFFFYGMAATTGWVVHHFVS